AVPPVDEAHPVFALRLVEDALRIVWLGGQQGGGGAPRLLELRLGGLEVAVFLVVLAGRLQELGPLPQRGRRQTGQVLTPVVIKRRLVRGHLQVEAPRGP